MPAIFLISRINLPLGALLAVLSLPVMFSFSYQLLGAHIMSQGLKNLSVSSTILLGRQAPFCLICVMVLSVLALRILATSDREA